MTLAHSIADYLKRTPALYQVARHAHTAVNERRPPLALPEVVGRIHRNDLMLDSAAPGDAAAYNRIGLEAIAAIGDALAETGRSWADVGHLLDLGCGHGRVLRHVVARIPAARVTACDLDPRAVAFCSGEFLANPLVGAVDLETVPFASYDVIWAGSLVTHLPQLSWQAWCRVAAGHLAPGGLLLFTTLGPASLDADSAFSPEVSSDRALISGELTQEGFAYRAYGHYADDSYGVAFHTFDHVSASLAPLGVTPLSQQQQLWGDNQDLHTFVRPMS